MPLNDYTNLRPVGNIGDSDLTNQIQYNTAAYWNWALLGIGGYINVTIPTTGAFGGNYHILKPTHDDAYNDGQVWQSIRKDWVWETGVEFTGTQPIHVSGVYINGNFYLPNDAIYGHTIDWKLGRIIFDTEIATTSVVTANYSYRYCQIYTDDDVDIQTEVQFRSTRPDDSHFDQMSSGNFIEHDQKIQLPCIVIENTTRGRKKGYQLGDGSIYVYPELLFHVLAESARERNFLLDKIDLNTPKTILMYNFDTMAVNDDIPLNFDGTLNSGAKMYPELVTDYLWKQLNVEDTEITAVQKHSKRFYTGTVRVKFSVISEDS